MPGSLLLLGLLGQYNSLDVGEDAALGSGDAREELVQLLVIADGQLQAFQNLITPSCHSATLAGAVPSYTIPLSITLHKSITYRCSSVCHVTTNGQEVIRGGVMPQGSDSLNRPIYWKMLARGTFLHFGK